MKAKSIKEMALEMLNSAIKDNNNEYMEMTAEAMQMCCLPWFIEAEYAKFKKGGDAREILSETSRELQAHGYSRLCVTVGSTIETLLTK